MVLPEPRMRRGGIWGLGLGAGAQILAYASLHRSDEPVAITSLSLVISVTTWMSVVFFLMLRLWVRLPGLAAGLGPVAFLAVFVSSLGMQPEAGASTAPVGTLPHVHVLLASAGQALLGIAGFAGLLYLAEHRRLKAKRSLDELVLPSLEALDRVNRVAIVVGFLLLSLGIVTGVFWLRESLGRVLRGSPHEAWMLISWAIYAGLVTARLAGRQSARQAAACALAGFVFLFVGVIGVGMLG
jgi:ABC-type uncharacterized transport system permease subunit